MVAEAMPYITHRRSDCNRVDGRTRQRVASVTSLAADEGTAGLGRTSLDLRSRERIASPCEVRPDGVEYLVRAARVTDIDRIVALRDEGGRVDCGESALDAADLLRQLVYLPQASVVVAETQRHVVGGAVLALRPSVIAGGFVGTIDLLVVDPGHDADRVTEALVEELLRSASNKGCSVVETVQPDDPMERTRLERLGFGAAGPRLQRNVTAAGAAARRPS
jgi:predicted N-acetyltransferase YhbS